MTKRQVNEAPDKTPLQVNKAQTRWPSARSPQAALHPVLQLHQTLGNRGIARLVRAGFLNSTGAVLDPSGTVRVGENHAGEREHASGGEKESVPNEFESQVDRIDGLDSRRASRRVNLRRRGSPEAEYKETVNPLNLNRILQRQAAPPNPAAAPVAANWKPPFDLPAVTTHDGARQATLAIWMRIANLQGELEGAAETAAAKNLELIAEEALTRTRSLTDDAPITAQEAHDLTAFGIEAEAANNQGVAILARKAEEALAPIANEPPPDTSAVEDQLAESLHDAFRKGSTDKIGELKEAITKLKEYKEKVSTVLTWAKRAAGAAKAAKTVEQLEKATGKLDAAGGVLGKVSDVLKAAHAFATISGLDNKAISPTQDAINKFQAGLDAIDIGMSFFKEVPLLGTLWSKYYMPLTKECLRLIGVIDRYDDIEKRQWGLFEFWKQQSSGTRKAGQAPTIPKDLMDAFPGGQPVMDFMFGIMHDSTPRPSPAVEQFFLAHQELFNVKQESWNTLESQGGSHWYKPWTWGSDEKLKNLVPWVQRNRQAIWSMLYGNLTPNL